jgi:ribosomal protein S18 acetylase RimI-like enzyme
MSTTIRQAGEADAEVISLLNIDVQRLHADAMPERFKQPGPDTFTATNVRTLLAKNSNLVFIAEINGEPVGYAYAELLRVSESPLLHAWNEVHLQHICVRPTFRRSGVASALLDSVRVAARERGVDLVTLQVWAFNNAAQAFFRAHGFTPYMTRLWSRNP